jgi:transcriptional regulator with XRE-family HTH domain
MNDQERRRSLAQFLRTRRERLVPEQMGFPTGARRRVKGLRREELAALAGIGVDWYTQLEKGRDITISTQVVESLAQVLGLNTEERNHFYVLARGQLPADPYPLTDIIKPALQAILDRMGFCPAYVVNPRWDILAWNQAMCHVYNDLDILPARARNVVRLMFLSPSYQILMVNWEQEAQDILALFRASTERYIGEAWLTALIADLQERSVEFREWWPRHDIQEVHRERKERNHPTVGRLVLQSTSFQVIDHPDLRMVVYTPLPEADTMNKLIQLAVSTKAQTTV